jgi:DNA-binding NtrC family response regulator
MERAAVICKHGTVEVGGPALQRRRRAERVPASPAFTPIPEGATLRDIERQVLLRTLAVADGNQSQAARILGLHESTLRFRLRRAGIRAPRRASPRKA